MKKQSVCKGCVYYNSCGSSSRTQECKGIVTKDEAKRLVNK